VGLSGVKLPYIKKNRTPREKFSGKKIFPQNIQFFLHVSIGPNKHCPYHMKSFKFSMSFQLSRLQKEKKFSKTKKITLI
jgi:hypothetical protein